VIKIFEVLRTEKRARERSSFPKWRGSRLPLRPSVELASTKVLCHLKGVLRVAVISGVIRSVGYQRGLLEIEVASGEVYRYFDAPYEVFIELCKSSPKARSSTPDTLQLPG
jgi:hypothetical protein